MLTACFILFVAALLAGVGISVFRDVKPDWICGCFALSWGIFVFALAVLVVVKVTLLINS